MIQRCWREVPLQPGLSRLARLLLCFLVAAVPGTGFLPAYPAATVSIANTSVAEGDSGTVDMVFTVTRTGDTALAVVVGYRTVDGTAIAGIDYTARTGTVTIPSGAATATIRVPVIGNAVFQSNRSFTVELTGVVQTYGPPVTLAAQQEFATGASPEAVAMADFDGDGRPDLATANYGGDSLTVLLNTTPPGAPQPTFAPGVNLAAPNGPQTISTGDFNLDGRPDLAPANSINTVDVFLNTTPSGGSRSFAAAQSLVMLTRPRAMTVVDLNADYRPDLAVTSDWGSTVSIFLNQTAPAAAAVTFAPRADLPTGHYPIALSSSEFTADGQPALAVANYYSDSGSIYLGATPPGALVPVFLPRADFAAGVHPAAVAVGDFNGDSRPDLALPNQTGETVTVLLNATVPQSAAPALQPVQSFAVGSWPSGVAVGDFNGDMQVDLAVADRAGHTVSVLVNTTKPFDTAAGFVPRQVFGGFLCPTGIVVGDFNGFGRPGLAVTNVCNSTVSVLLNPAPLDYVIAQLPVVAPLYEIDPATSEFTFVESVKAADFNGDGRPDLAVSILKMDPMVSEFSGSLGIHVSTVAAGDLKPSFAAPQFIDLGAVTGCLVEADFNRDGRPDLALAGRDGNVWVLLNTTPAGSPVISFATPLPFAAEPPITAMMMSPIMAATAGDMDGDGNPDIVVNGFYIDVEADPPDIFANIAVLRNTTAAGSPTASFAAAQRFVTSDDLALGGVVDTGDFNTDGRLDVAFAYPSTTVSVMLNTTAGGSPILTFGAVQDFAAGSGFIQISVGDVNGDGKPDLAMGGTNGTDVLVLLNTTASGASAAAFAGPQAIAVDGAPCLLTLRDAAGDSRPDLAVLVSKPDGSLHLSLAQNTTPAGAPVATFAAPLTALMDGDFSPVLSFISVGYMRPTIEAADFTLDGRIDLETLGVIFFETLVRVAAVPDFLPVQTIAGMADPASGIAAHAVGVGDFNLDGRPDVAVLVEEPFTPFGFSVWVWLNETVPGEAAVSFPSVTLIPVFDDSI